MEYNILSTDGDIPDKQKPEPKFTKVEFALAEKKNRWKKPLRISLLASIPAVIYLIIVILPLKDNLGINLPVLFYIFGLSFLSFPFILVYGFLYTLTLNNQKTKRNILIAAGVAVLIMLIVVGKMLHS